MSSFKKIAWSGSAVLLALVMALGLMRPTPASAATTTTTLGAATIALTTNGTNGTGAGTVLTTQPVITAAVATTDIPSGTTVLVKTPVGWTFTAQGTATGSATATLFGAGNVGVLSADAKTITYTTTAANGAGETVTWAGLAVRPDSNTSATGAITIQIGAGTAFTLANLTAGTALTASTTWTLVVTAPNTSLPADGSVGVLATATVKDGNGAIVSGIPISWTVSLGILGTGTSKTALSVTGNAGTTTQTYRGGGGNVATDTIITTNTTYSLVGTLTMNLVAASGTTAAKVVFQAPTILAVAANVTNTQPNYQSPTTGTTVSAQVQDASGLGVNAQQVLITVDKGAIYINTATGLGNNVIAAVNCAGQTSKSVTGPTSTQAQSNGGNAVSGVINIVYCGNQNDAAGKATLTIQNITTTMANATTSLSMAGRPAKVEATVTGAALAVKVSDAGGNAVADGTPVRFTISANAGAVSTGCTTTTNGAASAVAALIASTGLVIISSDWNETGAAATCAAAGAQQIAQSVNVSGGTASTTPGTPAAGGTGTLTSGSVPATGFGLIVFGGGTVAQLVTASGVGTSGALYATVGGNFVPYVPGTTIAAVNADFMAAFPGGNIPANTAFVGRK